MPIDFGAGLANMGETIGKFAGVAALEQQKSGLEAEKLKLANDLAGERESKGRQETAALQATENRTHEGFLSSEGAENRKTQLQAAQISAGSAAATANAHLKGIQMQLDAAKEQGEFKVNEDGSGVLINRHTGKSQPLVDEKGEALKFANPEKAKAQAELITLTKDQLTATTRQYEIEYRQASTELQTTLKSLTSQLEPGKNPDVIDAKKRLDDIQKKYEPQIKVLQHRADLLSQALTGKTGLPIPAAPTGKKLSDFDPPPTGGLIGTP